MVNLINADCMEVMATFKDKQFDLAIVDPPYGLKEANGREESRNLSRKRAKTKVKYTIKNWDNSVCDKAFFIELKRVSINQIIWGANHFIENIPNSNSSCWIVWDKDNGQSDFADCELAWCSFKKAVRKIKWRWNGMIQEDMKNKEVRIHPTQKPVALYKWLLETYTSKGDLILDTHLGSGSIAIACHDLGYDLTGIELDKEYYDAAVKRYNQHKSQLQIW